MVHLTVSPAGVHLSAGGEVILPHQTWADYEDLLECRGDNAAVKVRYNARRQEIFLISRLAKYGNHSAALGNLVQALLQHIGLDWEGYDPITLKRFGEAGLEPDKCFYIAHRAAILGKERIDLETDPPPDLAIEIDATSSTHPEDYSPLGIPELWIFREDALHIYLFDGQHYNTTPESPTFPGLPVGQWIPDYLRRAWEAGSSVALREFEAVLKAYRQ